MKLAKETSIRCPICGSSPGYQLSRNISIDSLDDLCPGADIYVTVSCPRCGHSISANLSPNGRITAQSVLNHFEKRTFPFRRWPVGITSFDTGARREKIPQLAEMISRTNAYQDTLSDMVKKATHCDSNTFLGFPIITVKGSPDCAFLVSSEPQATEVVKMTFGRLRGVKKRKPKS